MAAEPDAAVLLDAMYFRSFPPCLRTFGRSGLSFYRSICRVLLQILDILFPTRVLRTYIILENRTVALRNSLALGPWHVRLNLDVTTHSTSAIEHPGHRKGQELGDVIKNISLIVQHIGETYEDFDRRLKTTVIVGRVSTKI